MFNYDYEPANYNKESFKWTNDSTAWWHRAPGLFYSIAYFSLNFLFFRIIFEFFTKFQNNFTQNFALLFCKTFAFSLLRKIRIFSHKIKAKFLKEQTKRKNFREKTFFIRKMRNFMKRFFLSAEKGGR